MISFNQGWKVRPPAKARNSARPPEICQRIRITHAAAQAFSTLPGVSLNSRSSTRRLTTLDTFDNFVPRQLRETRTPREMAAPQAEEDQGRNFKCPTREKIRPGDGNAWGFGSSPFGLLDAIWEVRYPAYMSLTPAERKRLHQTLDAHSSRRRVVWQSLATAKTFADFATHSEHSR